MEQFNRDDGGAQYVCDQVEAKAIGARLTRAVVGDGGFPALLCRHDDGRVLLLHVQSDAEGNSPGWLNIEEVGA